MYYNDEPMIYKKKCEELQRYPLNDVLKAFSSDSDKIMTINIEKDVDFLDFKAIVFTLIFCKRPFELNFN